MKSYKDDPIPYEELRERCARYEADLERAVKVVLVAGFTTGHAETCSGLVEEVVSQAAALRVRIVKRGERLARVLEEAEDERRARERADVLLHEERKTTEQLAAAVKRLSDAHLAWLDDRNLGYSEEMIEAMGALYELAGVEWEEG